MNFKFIIRLDNKNFLEGLKMAVAKKDEKVLNVVDVFWDGWFNSFKTFQSFQKEVEEKSLQVFESQKELVQAASKQLSQLEEESKKLTTELTTNVQQVLKNALSVIGADNLLEITDKFEEVGKKAETVAFSPSKATIDVLSKSHAQIEKALKDAIAQQQKNRAEVLNAIGGYVDQLKETQNGVLKTFELNNALIAK
jgi:GTPase involved in cell partitioning and DNA repair